MEIPPRCSDRRLYKFHLMEVGGTITHSRRSTNSLKSSASTWKHDHPGWDYTTRTIGDQIVLWRTK